MTTIKDITKEKAIMEKETNFQSMLDHSKKIVTAIFMLTDLVDEKSGIDLILRKKILEHFQALLSFIRDINPKELKKAEESLYETLSFIDILYGAGMISEMNYRIISREIIALRKQVLAEKKKKKKITLSDLFFEEDKKEKLIPAQNNFSESREQASMTENKDKKTVKEIRHRQILDLLAQNEKLSISDIARSFDGYSSKTLQRDLKELIEKKKVFKQGERRWASYRLLKNKKS